jgi:peptide-methionine (S)-S-oxide reductase
MEGAAMGEAGETAVLAGGCFWGMQELLRRHEGVLSTRVGYTGGAAPDGAQQRDGAVAPGWDEWYGEHGHAEAVEIVFDPERVSYRDLLEFFFQIHDPSTKDRQGVEVGTHVRSEIFYTSGNQRLIAKETVADVDACGLWPGEVLTTVSDAGPFWEAEPEHQDYIRRHSTAEMCHYPRPGWRLARREAQVRQPTAEVEETVAGDVRS